MASLWRAAALCVAAAATAFVVSHHIAYFRGGRAPTFGAFLETAGWLILLLVSLGILGGGLDDAGPARVVVASAVVAVACIGTGRYLHRSGARRG